MTTTSATRTLLTIVAVSIAVVLPASAEEWSKTYTVTANPDLRIETTDANIRVNTWDQNTIEARVITNRYKIGEGGIRVEEHQTGNSVEIEVRYPRHNFNFEWGPSHRVDIIVQVRIGGDRIGLRPLLGAGGKNHSNGYSHDRSNVRVAELSMSSDPRRADTLSPSLLDGSRQMGEVSSRKINSQPGRPWWPCGA